MYIYIYIYINLYIHIHTYDSIYQRVGAAFSGKDDWDGMISADSSTSSKSTVRPLPLFSYDRRSQDRECPGINVYIIVYTCIKMYI
jgi:hypothetical protein